MGKTRRDWGEVFKDERTVFGLNGDDILAKEVSSLPK
jgi:hypothetical protein